MPTGKTDDRGDHSIEPFQTCGQWATFVVFFPQLACYARFNRWDAQKVSHCYIGSRRPDGVSATSPKTKQKRSNSETEEGQVDQCLDVLACKGRSRRDSSFRLAEPVVRQPKLPNYRSFHSARPVGAKGGCRQRMHWWGETLHNSSFGSPLSPRSHHFPQFATISQVYTRLSTISRTTPLPPAAAH